MAGRHGTDGYASKPDVREHARRSALAGRAIWCNPYVGDDAELWFTAYREVPEADRGSDPSAFVATHRRKNGGKRTRSSEAQVRALGDRTLPGSTPRPFQQAILAEVAEAEARTPRPWAVDGVGL